MKPPISKRVAVGGLLFALFVAGWLVGWSRATARDHYENVDLFVEVLSKIDQFYVDPVSSDELVEGAVEGMLRELDPFSAYLDERSYDDLQATTQGQFGGLGIVVSIRDEFPTVISPLEGTPAYSLGIQSGDVITEIDGDPTRGMAIDEVVNELRGEEGTQVTVTIRREGESEPMEYTITREIIRVKSVPYSMIFAGDVGYVRVSSFSASTGAELRRELESLERQGARALIVDLRENPGGLLTEAVDVAELFLPRGSVVVETRGRGRNSDHTYTSSHTRPHLSQPLVVLVSPGSASASEIVAGAIQDHDRGLVLGRTTFGKGSVQSVINLPGTRAALKLTTAKYYTPTGRSIHRDEFEPGVENGPDRLAARERAAAPDTVARPIFRTESGRVVYGGGGIKPDIEVIPDSLGTISRAVERRGLFFKFAVQHVARTPGQTERLVVDPALWRSFVDFLGEEEIEVTPESQLGRERAYLEAGIRREVARRVGGDAAAFRAFAPADPALQRALDLLRQARGPRELIQLSSIQ